MFDFTTEERRAAFAKRVKKHENMVAMKKRRLDCQRRSEVDERTSDESDDPLVGQAQKRPDLITQQPLWIAMRPI